MDFSQENWYSFLSSSLACLCIGSLNMKRDRNVHSLSIKSRFNVYLKQVCNAIGRSQEACVVSTRRRSMLLVCNLKLQFSEPFSSIHSYDSNGIHWSYLTNVCLNLANLNIIVFIDEHHHNPFSERLHGFQHRWTFKRQKRSFPTPGGDYRFFEGEGNWMIIPGWSQHTSHFAENAMMINHHASLPNSLPPVCECD